VKIGQSLDELMQVNEHLLNPLRGRVTQELESLDALAVHLVAAELAWRQRKRMALNAAAKLVKEDAREQIGEYQPQAGNYPEWAELAESTEEEKTRLGAPPDAPLLRFGDLQKSFRSTLNGDDEVVIGSTDPVLEYHEFGTVKMPPRPVLGPALLKHINEIRQILSFAILDVVISGQRMGYRFNAEAGGIVVPEAGETTP
jgi:HK97 gp10 family phage protein